MRRSRKESAVTGCQPTVYVADGGVGHMSSVGAAGKDFNHGWSRMIYRFSPRVNALFILVL